MQGYPRGVIHAKAECSILHIDCGKYVSWWTNLCFYKNDPTDEIYSGLVAEYGTIEVPSDSLGEIKALGVALREFFGRIMSGWQWHKHDHVYIPDLVLIDAGYQTDQVCDFVRWANAKDPRERFMPVVGRGLSQQRKEERSPYYAPKQTDKNVQYIGQECHVTWWSGDNRNVFAVVANADYWKTIGRQLLAQPISQSGAVTLYHGSNTEHTTWTKHINAEEPVEEFVEGEGNKVRWVHHSRANHYLDNYYNTLVGASLCNVEFIPKTSPNIRSLSAPATPSQHQYAEGDQQSYLITDR